MKKNREYHLVGTPDFPVSVGIEIAGKSMRSRPVSYYHRETEIAMQVAGTSVNQLEDQIITHRTGDIWIIPAGVSHRRIRFSEDSVIHWIIFSPDAITMQSNHFFQKSFTQPLSEGRLEMPALLQPGHPCYEKVGESLVQAKDCRYYGEQYKEKRLLILMQICLTLLPYCSIKENVPLIPQMAPEGVQLCMRYIHNRYHTKIKMEELAKFCHLHPNRLSAIFKQHTGQSVFEYLTKFRIEVAIGLLEREDLPVSKIAELSGFPSECLFYRKFKEIMGVSPKTYAKSLKPFGG